MSALDSGMDVLIEISGQYFERIIRKIYGAYRICLDGTFEFSVFGAEPLPYRVRKVIPVIRDERPAVELRRDAGGVKIDLHMRLTYGEVDVPGIGWIDIPPETEETFSIGLTSVSHEGTAKLVIDLSGLPPEVQMGIGEISPIPLPLDFLTQRATAPDGATVTPWSMTTREIQLKVIDGNLLIGLDVSLSQDQRALISHGFRLGPDLEESDDLGGTPRVCVLPFEPEIEPSRFELFTESFLGDNEWAIALDGHLVDAMLRGTSTAINRRESLTDDSPHDGDIRFACLTLGELHNGFIQVRGNFSSYKTPDWPAPDDWYVVDTNIEVRLNLTDRLSAHARLIDAWTSGSDSGWEVCSHAFDYIPESDRERDITVFPDLYFGDDESSLGRLRMRNVEIRPKALLIQGVSHLTAPRLSISAPRSVRFATPCDADEELVEEFTISRIGYPSLHICPLDIKGADADNFSILAPDELREGGEGLTMFPDAARTIRIGFNGEPDRLYTASLRIPNNARRGVEVALTADLRETSGAISPEELEFRRTDYMTLCTGEFERFPTIRRNVEVTNIGPGYLRFCSLEITPGPTPPSTLGVFRLWGGLPDHTPIAPGESFFIGVEFNPGESGIGEEIRRTLRILTNASPLEVALVGRIDRSTDWSSDPVIGSFAGGRFAGSFADAYGFFCGMIDWKLAREGGLLLNPSEMDEFIPVLGGRLCCPPPHTPACLCADFLELAFKQVPRGMSLSVLDESGNALFTDRARFRNRIMVVPINKDHKYALRSKPSQSVFKAPPSPFIMKRWIAQQEGIYETNRILSDLAVYGKYAYAASPDGIEIISLADFEKPVQIGLVKTAHPVVSLSVFKQYLVAAGTGLEIFSLAEPEKLRLISSLSSVSEIKTLITTTTDGRPLLFPYAIGQQLYVLDLSDPKLPKAINRFNTNAQANRAVVRDNNAYLFGQGGLELLDLSNPHQPNSLSFFSTRKEVHNGTVFGPYALLIYNHEEIDFVDVSIPPNLQIASNWRLESWFKDYVPLAGGLIKSRGHLLILKGDQHGIRMMRILRNSLDKGKLLKRRSQHHQVALHD